MDSHTSFLVPPTVSVRGNSLLAGPRVVIVALPVIFDEKPYPSVSIKCFFLSMSFMEAFSLFASQGCSILYWEAL